MDNELKATFGSWVQAIGTTLSAIGATPSKNISDTLLGDLNLWGNVLQATGNSLVADSEKNFTLEKIGNEIQAIGGTTEIHVKKGHSMVLFTIYNPFLLFTFLYTIQEYLPRLVVEYFLNRSYSLRNVLYA